MYWQVNMRRVIVESPYAGNVQKNLWYLWACLRDSLWRGDAPFASHAFYTLPNVLDDTDVLERERGIHAGYAWAKHADAIIFYTDLGWSKGMLAAKAYHSMHSPHCTIEERTIPGWSESSCA
jgi:hypothetical protein